MHVHVISDDGAAKYWLEPEIELATSHGYNRKQLSEIENLAEGHREELVSASRQHFGS